MIAPPTARRNTAVGNPSRRSSGASRSGEKTRNAAPTPWQIAIQARSTHEVRGSAGTGVGITFVRWEADRTRVGAVLLPRRFDSDVGLGILPG